MDIEDIIGEAELPQRTVTICVRGDLVARWEELREQWRNAPEVGPSLGEPSPKQAMAGELRELQEEMRDKTRTLVFQALPPEQYSALMLQHPPNGAAGNNRFNYDTFLPALVSACAVNPTMNPDQVRRLFAKVSTAQRTEIGNAAYMVNEGAVDVPFEGAVYAETQSSGSE